MAACPACPYVFRLLRGEEFNITIDVQGLADTLEVGGDAAAIAEFEDKFLG